MPPIQCTEYFYTRNPTYSANIIEGNCHSPHGKEELGEVKGFVKTSQSSDQKTMWAIASYAVYSLDQPRCFLRCESGLMIKWQLQGCSKAGACTAWHPASPSQPPFITSAVQVDQQLLKGFYCTTYIFWGEEARDTMCMWKSDENVQEYLFSIHNMSTRDQTQVIEVGSKCR